MPSNAAQGRCACSNPLGLAPRSPGAAGGVSLPYSASQTASRNFRRYNVTGPVRLTRFALARRVAWSFPGSYSAYPYVPAGCSSAPAAHSAQSTAQASQEEPLECAWQQDENCAPIRIQQPRGSCGLQSHERVWRPTQRECGPRPLASLASEDLRQKTIALSSSPH